VTKEELNTFCKIVQHAPDSNGQVEKTKLRAVEVDGTKGLACNIGFNDGTLSKVDYFGVFEDNVQFIELTDLKKTINKCTYLESADLSVAKKIPLLNLKDDSWNKIVDEFKLKYQGSMAIAERCFSLQTIQYTLLIVVKNNTETNQLDVLKNRLRGMTQSTINICTTNYFHQFIKDNQCQE
jgi:hypothetical protein